jgi:hypothetical protein
VSKLLAVKSYIGGGKKVITKLNLGTECRMKQYATKRLYARIKVAGERAAESKNVKWQYFVRKERGP